MNFDKRTSLDIENESVESALNLIFAAFLILTAAGLIIAAAIYL